MGSTNLLFRNLTSDGLLNYCVPLLASSSLWLVVTHVGEIAEKLVATLVHIRTGTASMSEVLRVG
jgi:hypothetical protein